MDKLTDLELITAIAKIEKLDLVTMFVWNKAKLYDREALFDESFEEFNPLTDKAMLLDLILKYKVQLSHYESMIDVRIYDDPEDNPVAWIRFSDDATNFSRFVLLCILGANNG